MERDAAGVTWSSGTICGSIMVGTLSQTGMGVAIGGMQSGGVGQCVGERLSCASFLLMNYTDASTRHPAPVRGVAHWLLSRTSILMAVVLWLAQCILVHSNDPNHCQVTWGRSSTNMVGDTA